MSTLSLYAKLEMLPNNLKQEAANFIDFLLEKALAKEKKSRHAPEVRKGK